MDQADQALNEFLAGLVTEERKRLIDKVLDQRTRHLAVVLEDIYQPQNASAVIRTCDCFGIQAVYVIENANEYHVNPRVVHGASKWVELYRYNELQNNTRTALMDLKSKGYTLLGTVPDQNAPDIHSCDFSTPTALVFGTEALGISEEAKELCDKLVTYPMYGFTESLNISVSASLCLSVAVNKMKDSNVSWGLSDQDKANLRLSWYRYSVSRVDVLEREFRKRMK